LDNGADVPFPDLATDFQGIWYSPPL